MTFQLDVSFRFIGFRAALDSFGGPRDDLQDNETLRAPTKSCEYHPQQLRRLQVLRQGRGREGPDVRRKNWRSPGRCMLAYSLWPCDKLCFG